ncbi:hypothetical protein PDESU_00164 [Pontiella desulfatans]|uniref:AAA+ ATPase domain-containing protein n=1 Tax=Pontiella desulfatans TaxID=2750659 RepID=A0A6C2TVH7_PONDE|nr:DNA repair ATPase [Pontiella desulfatans]VGO11619.1 hypothetical protein PDESU_00164 [Pontiella desulfatans]
MAEETEKKEQGAQLESGTYEVIRGRLNTHARDLLTRIDQLDQQRREVFGSIETTLLGTERITTENNCIPRDMIEVGEQFLFGYNVHIGLRSEMHLVDVFSVYTFNEDGGFRAEPLDLIGNNEFNSHFKELYKYYKNTTFAAFRDVGPFLYMVFRISDDPSDIKAFKWQRNDDGTLTYIDNRSDHEVKFPPQHEFEWNRATRDMQRTGVHPHISIEERIFVETIGGDLTIKIEDNTESGEGIFAEPVDNPDQTLDDAEVWYACIESLILLKILPYQEKDYRYIVYSEKLGTAHRIDAIADSCVLLPRNRGIIFANGYFLQNGEVKTFDNNLLDMRFLRRIAAPNGEDHLYVFFNRRSGLYILLAYNVIKETVGTPIICHGYSHFQNGRLIFFKAGEEPQKSHAIQLWQTPFTGPDVILSKNTEDYLYKIGNSDIVRCMAACHTIVNLSRREDSYANLYIDLVRETQDVIDAYFWIEKEEAFVLREPLLQIRDAAKAAIDEFEKVRRLRQQAAAALKEMARRVKEATSASASSRYQKLDPYVKALANLRALRGETISLRELRYMDLDQVEAMEAAVAAQAERTAHTCVEFLLKPESLIPYADDVETVSKSIESVEKVSDAKKIEQAVGERAAELEMLTDTVSNLKIDDATHRTDIIDRISQIFSALNRVRATLTNRIKELAAHEGAAEFASQLKLLSQAVTNYLDVCDSPAKCDEYLGKMMIQIEELEGRFSDFDDFITQLTERREEIYQTFETRKQQLMEERNRKADTLLRSAERILKSIGPRLGTMQSVEEINGYFAADLMVDKVRNIIGQLAEMDDTVKSGDIQTQLKTLREDAIRQLKDQQELFVAGENVIKFGTHHFAVNTQPLELTLVRRDDNMLLHLTGTDFFEAVTDETFLATRAVWELDLPSETADLYRGEFLAVQLFRKALADALPASTEKALVNYVQEHMATRYTEGYIKGVNDIDAAKILHELLGIHQRAGLLRYSPSIRALALLGWTLQANKTELANKLEGYGRMRAVFRSTDSNAAYTEELHHILRAFAQENDLFPATDAGYAAEYLFDVLTHEGKHPISREAMVLHNGFEQRMKRPGAKRLFDEAMAPVKDAPLAKFSLLRDWLAAFIEDENQPELTEALEETAALMLTGNIDPVNAGDLETRRELEGFAGSHARIADGKYQFDYHDLLRRVHLHEQELLPSFTVFQREKKALIERTRDEMRLEEFKPRVLTSFVRNQLIDKLYLPLIGDNLAKQMGTVGVNTRTDRMGMLLLISPPGYGKTTLMEYIANRLGIIFMKINGPAIGHQVTSIDPAEAPNAAARQELNKLNLALEMGDNVMLYLDDIQHCNPELLQKFISLCDAQRKIEGVYKGRPKTYDLRGKSVCVVMAGNPYTESGEMFKVPDMLANRADTYNLGDMIGDSGDAFKLSYIENAMTSNAVLDKLASRTRADIHAMIRLAQTGSREGIEFERDFSADEIGEFTSVLKKMLRIRDVVLAVNQEYIRSAAQSDDYRTEPPFKLQGSYRNMNRLAEKVQPIMNDAEIETILLDHYTGEAQTLTTGAEANLLKFKELFGLLDETETARWADIRKTFNRNLLFSAAGDDKLAPIILQLTNFNDQLGSLRDTIAAAAGGGGSKPGKVTASLSKATLEALQFARPDFSPLQQTLLEIAEKIQAAHPQNKYELPHHMRNPLPKDVRDDKGKE